MPLVFTLRSTSTIPLELFELTDALWQAQSCDELARLRLPHGNQRVELGEFFSISGSAADEPLAVFQGDARWIKGIGARLAAGTIRIEGSAGMHLGQQMSGGTIDVFGSAGDWAGAEMRGGLLRIRGSAGDYVGSAYRGARRGMRGGEIVVFESCGNEPGSYMRRGTIAVGGKAGHAAGHGVIAGTLVLAGGCGRWAGAGLKRGTILIHGPHEGLLSSFAPSAVLESPFTRLLWRRLANLGFPVPQGARDCRYERFCGDLLSLGKGELLVPAHGV
jgi:formylmethanofuran dehydrogenase subunit C